MKSIPLSSGLAAFAFLLLAGFSAAQETSTPAEPPRAAALTGEAKTAPPTAEELRGQLDAIESDATREDVVKESLAKRYREAIESAAQAASYRAIREKFSQSLKSGPEEVSGLESELEEIRQAEPASPPDPSLTAEEVAKTLTEIKRQRAGLIANLGDSEKTISELQGRPEAIPAELSEARTQLRAAQTELEETSPGDDPSSLATRASLRSRIDALEARIDMLETENLSSEIRLSRATLSRDLLSEQIARIDQQIERLEAKAADRVSENIRRAERLVETSSGNEAEQKDSDSSDASALAQRTTELQEASDSLKHATEAGEARSRLLEKIETSFNSITTQFQQGVASSSLAPLLQENLKVIPHPWESALQLRSLQSRISDARLRIFEIRQESEAPSEDFADAAKTKRGNPEMEEVTTQIREDLLSTYQRLIDRLRESMITEQRLRDVSGEFRDYAESKLFSVRSASALTPGSLVHLPEAATPVFGSEQFAQLGRVLRKVPPSFWILCVLIVAIGIGVYVWLERWLVRIGIRARHYSTERYRQTVLALVLTLLLALALPALAATAGLALAIQSFSLEWIRAFGSALIMTAKAMFPVLVLLVVSRKNGLADAHFRWDPKILTRIRKFCLLLLPLLFLTSLSVSLIVFSSHFGSTSSPVSELKRIPLLLLVIGGGALLANLLHPQKGIAALSFAGSPASLFGKLRAVWYWMVITSIVILALLLLAGYIYTALQLLDRLVASYGSLLIAFLVYGMFHRWVTIREHKEARRQWNQAREERLRARSEGEESGENVSEVVSDEDVEAEEDMDPVTVGEQTKRFLAFFTGLWLLWQLYTIWGQFGPLADSVGRIDAIGPLSIGEILYAIIVVAILISTIRNLPGILEILVFQRTRLDEGTKTAVVTLANYAAIAIAAVAIFRNLGVDWSHFGWIAAALSVGLGFGLQEVVANFVSGIILLFERPIRVGDVITIDGVDGKVSRIQIRATTILDWDRKELIVPNKRFITGTLQNWTRSNSINRIVIPVGVAYGTDTAAAREILLQIAEEHPEIMEDPAPVATFEAFGDSTLNLVLRVYLANLDNRLGIITELHTRIDERFKEAGIEIAFPQLDLHLKGTGGDAGEGKELRP